MRIERLLLVLACLALAFSQPSCARSTQPARSATPIEGAIDPLVAAACWPDRCLGTIAGKRLLSASTSAPIIPPSWTVPTWYIDPANSATCASDSNSGTAATCTGGCAGSVCTSGVGPLLTFQELAVHRWGTYSPRLRQVTTRNWLSSHTSNSDPVYSLEYIENGAYLVDTCPLGSAQTVGTGTIGSVTGGAATRSGNAVLQATFTIGGSPTLLAGMLVQNTMHASYSVLAKFVSGTTWKVQQPLAAVSIPYNVAVGVPNEVTNWTNSDAVTVYQPVAINFAQLASSVTDPTSSSTFNAAHFVNHCNIYQPASTSPPAVLQNVQLSEMTSFRSVTISGNASVSAQVAGVNVLFANNLYSSSPVSGSFEGGPTFIGGAFVGNTTTIGGATLDGDVAFMGGTGIFLSGFNFINTVIVDTGSRLNILAGGMGHVAVGNYAASVLYGAGIGNLEGQARIDYPSGASAASADLLIATLQVNGQTKTCLGVPSVTSPTLACNITLTNTNLDSNLGATSGCLWVEGGAAVCNIQ